MTIRTPVGKASGTTKIIVLWGLAWSQDTSKSMIIYVTRVPKIRGKMMRTWMKNEGNLFEKRYFQKRVPETSSKAPSGLHFWRSGEPKAPPETAAKRLKTGCRAANAGSTGLRKPKQATRNRKDEIPGRQRPPWPKKPGRYSSRAGPFGLSKRLTNN